MGRKGKAESIASTLRPEKGWEIPSSPSESIVIASGCGCQGSFRAGEAFPLAEASQLSPVPRKDLGARFCGGLF